LPAHIGAMKNCKATCEVGCGAAVMLEQQSEGSTVVRVQCGVGPPGSRHAFFVYVHNQRGGGFHPIETWYFLIEAFECTEIVARVGESTEMLLPDCMRGCLEVWTSHPMLTWDKGSSLCWAPRGTGMSRVMLTARMPGAGRVRSALVECEGRPSAVRHSYIVTVLPLLETAVELSYTSPFREGKQLQVCTDRTDVLRLTPGTGALWFEPHEEKDLGVRVKPLTAGSELVAMLFVNDEHGKTLDCFAIKVACGSDQGHGYANNRPPPIAIE